MRSGAVRGAKVRASLVAGGSAAREARECWVWGRPERLVPTCTPRASPLVRTDMLSRSYRDSGWWGTSRHQGGDEFAEEGSASAPGVVHDLEEGEIERQLLLRDAAVRTQPGAQQGPDALGRVDVDLAEPVAIVVPGVLAPGVAHGLVAVAPLLQPGVDVVLVGVHQRTFRDTSLDDGPDRHLLHVGEHAQGDLAAALDQAEDRRLVLRQRAAARRSR